jgi:hypothetical protein
MNPGQNKTDGRTDGQTDGQPDSSIPPQTLVLGGINTFEGCSYGNAPFACWQALVNSMICSTKRTFNLTSNGCMYLHCL